MSIRFLLNCVSVCVVFALSASPALGVGIITVTINPANLTGGATATGAVTLSAAAPSGGYQVRLSSDNGAASVPTSLTVPGGQTTATFNMTTIPVINDTYVFISVSATGSTTRRAQISVHFARLATLTVPSTMAGGSTATGTIKLNGKAAAIIQINLTANHPLNVPAYVRIHKGIDTINFTFKADVVRGQQNPVISAQMGGTTLSQPVTVKP